MKMNIKIVLGVVGVGLVLGACRQVVESEVEVVVEPSVKGELVSAGTFEGRSDHVVTGGVEIVKADGVYVVNLKGDFSLDGAPDPKVGLGKDGYDATTKAGDLKNKEGASSYQLPEGVDPSKYNEVYIWCEKFDVPLGVAKLSAEK